MAAKVRVSHKDGTADLFKFIKTNFEVPDVSSYNASDCPKVSKRSKESFSLTGKAQTEKGRSFSLFETSHHTLLGSVQYLSEPPPWKIRGGGLRKFRRELGGSSKILSRKKRGQMVQIHTIILGVF